MTFAVAAVLVARFDRPLGAGFVALLAAIAAVVAGAPRRCLPAARAHAEDMGRLHGRLEELAANREAVVAADRRGAEVAALRRTAVAEFFGSHRRTGRCARGHRAVLALLVIAALGAAVWRLGALARRGARPPERCVGTFVLLTSLLGSVLWVVDLVEQDIVDVGQLAACERVFGDDGAPPPRRRPPPGRAPPPAERYALGLVDVTFRHGAAGGGGVRGLTVHFARGERTALVGPVGAGKTTVLRLLLGLYTPEPGGDAYYAGRWYADRPLAAVRAAVGYVPQQPVLFDRSVLENVMYGNAGRADPAAAAALIAESGLAAGLADGVHTAVGPGGARLSGGQRQLVWCLRVLLRDPAVVLMDEPTAAMDAATRDILLALLERLMRGRTVVLVSHDPALAATATRRVALTADGTVAPAAS